MVIEMKRYFLVYNVKNLNDNQWEQRFRMRAKLQDPTSQCDQMKLKHIFMYTVFGTYIS